MLSSAKIGTRSWRYYTDSVACRATEYYLGVGEAPGRWAGAGLPALGLEQEGRVSEQQLEALFSRGLHPASGDKLGMAWRTDGVTGYDLTFSAPKSVSALWALGSDQAGDAVAAAALAAHQQAARAGLAYLENHAALSRRGTDGVEQVATGGLTAALFDHRTSRAGDPQLHTHALVLNKALCRDGVWRTLDGTEIYAHLKTAGIIYQAALRNEMQRRLGVDFETVSIDGQAEITGVPAGLLKTWSKRKAAIIAQAEPKIAAYEKTVGRELSKGERFGVTKTAVMQTRPGKAHLEIGTLRATWTAEAAAIGWTPDRLARATGARTVTLAGHQPGAAVEVVEVVEVGGDPGGVGDDSARQRPYVTPIARGQDSGQDPRQELGSVGQDSRGSRERVGKSPELAETTDPGVTDTGLAFAAVQAAGRRAAVFSRNDVAGRVAAQLPTEGLTGTQVLARIEQLTNLALALSETVPIGQPTRGVTPRESDALYATIEVLQAEARILTHAQQGRGAGHGQVGSSQVRAAAVALASTSPSAAAKAGAPDASGAADGQGRRVGLDPGQAAALVRLTSSGDLLSVLTAPAGAGKTSTLGAASTAWTAAGYRVVGLAPSARAAAELHDATGGRTDTLAKWLHNHHRLEQGQHLPPAEHAWTVLDGRTVVIVDEASMASTLDLDRLTTAAAASGSKVVLVGDPGQIGVINGPGGMLAALTHAGHAIELEQIHRFTRAWERSASLQLRAGNPGVLDVYQAKDRLHPCADGDTALRSVFEHWTRARAEGQDALMLARTRLDVDALNTLARQAAQAAGTVTGPAVTAGDREWQAGDLLRTRRNQRTLTLTNPPSTADTTSGADAPGHVHNGDRYRVIGPATSAGPDGKQTPTGGLVVEDLAGRGRVILPPEYLAEHCEYGWASTIDAAQGATADIGLVLVRPGLDREHLYVAMTRGRHGNHAYITTDQPEDPDHDHRHHGPSRAPAAREVAPAAGAPGVGAPEAAREAHQVLRAALSQSGAQDAAHTTLAKARDAARQAAGQTRDGEQHLAVRSVSAQGNRPESSPAAEQPLPAEHLEALEALRQLRQERHGMLARQAQLRATIETNEAGLLTTSLWARGQRRELTVAPMHDLEELAESAQQVVQIENQIDLTTLRLDGLDRQRKSSASGRSDQEKRVGQGDRAAALARQSVWRGTEPGSLGVGSTDRIGSDPYRPREPVRPRFGDPKPRRGQTPIASPQSGIAARSDQQPPPRNRTAIRRGH